MTEQSDTTAVDLADEAGLPEGSDQRYDFLDDAEGLDISRWEVMTEVKVRQPGSRLSDDDMRSAVIEDLLHEVADKLRIVVSAVAVDPADHPDAWRARTVTAPGRFLRLDVDDE
ncbi:hypothetical protein [Pseudokineococcus lusitanus]|uniref:Uncharacterized protein n=1 Tax=Pseudokineococcus lusitanus TaxID=763993 RepID=A0A3N1HTT6_9ACTN|nr:hypothetical protein [Pseudokineococcus lusitanus]ROP45935.1 hypothetical protein EDC03_0550 [Pseudokineococcus lusitanus]